VWLKPSTSPETQEPPPLHSSSESPPSVMRLGGGKGGALFNRLESVPPPYARGAEGGRARTKKRFPRSPRLAPSAGAGGLAPCTPSNPRSRSTVGRSGNTRSAAHRRSCATGFASIRGRRTRQARTSARCASRRRFGAR